MSSGASFELIELLANVAQRSGRVDAIAALSRYLRVEAVLVFVLDHEVGMFLSAAGFPQALPDGAAWQRYLVQCAKAGRHDAMLPFPTRNKILQMTGLAWNGQMVLVLGGSPPGPVELSMLSRLQPLLAVSLINEQLLNLQTAEVGLARRMAEESTVLAEGLDNARRSAQKEIVARKDVEKALKVVGDELATSNAALIRARDSAVASAAAKDDFLAALSHELRTPLNPVLLVSGEAAEDLSLPGEVRADFAMIAKNVELEARLIDDLLDLTRISRGKMQFDRNLVSVTDVLRDSVAMLRSEIAEKNLSLRMELSSLQPVVLGDAVRLQQIFWNVIRNAVKFTPVGGSISLTQTVDLARQIVTIEVRDSGIGLTAAEIDRIFEAFSQGDHAGNSGSHRFGGLGLGLAISKTLAQMHGGQIRASSPGQGRGSSFFVELPYNQPGTGDLSLKVRSDVELDGPAISATLFNTANEKRERFQILLVEDHVPSRDVLGALLGKRGFEIHSAGSVADARELAGQKNFDLLISDLGLPDGDGHQLMNALRASQPDLKGIALTGYGMEADLAHTLASGFSAHLVKPVNMRELERVIASLLPAKIRTKL